MALDEFDFSVINYAESRGETSESVYNRLTAMDPKGYRDQKTLQQLLAKLERLKIEDTKHEAVSKK